MRHDTVFLALFCTLLIGLVPFAGTPRHGVALAAVRAQKVSEAMRHDTNRRLADALARFRGPVQGRGADESAPSRTDTEVQKGVAWPDLCATTDMGGRVSTPGPRGTWRTRPSDPYVALPSARLRGRTVLVQCQCAAHGEMSPWVPFRVHDTGPWSRFDAFVAEMRRPMVEAGRSDTYRRVPRKAPAIDLTPGAWAKLGHPGKGNRFTGRVSLAVLERSIPKTRKGD